MHKCRTLLFDSNCAALHSANFVNDITCPTGDRMYVLVQGTGWIRSTTLTH